MCEGKLEQPQSFIRLNTVSFVHTGMSGDDQSGGSGHGSFEAIFERLCLKGPPTRTCFVYDDRMLLHHDNAAPAHPERPARLASAYQTLIDYGLIQRCERLAARDATREELAWLHTADYIEKVASSATMTQAQCEKLDREEFAEKFVYFCQQTYRASLLAAGSSVQVVDNILSGKSLNGLALVRPPGHHAESDTAFGFCFFNNTAVAARYAIEHYNLKRVLIVDWDVHHGNGVQRCFFEDPRVMYVSLHRLDAFPFNPHESDCHVIGAGRGTGYTINVAWPKAGMGDAEYLAAFHQVIMPVAYQYNPELVVVASGFDAAIGDPLGECRVSPECYGHMTHLLSSLARGRMAVILEGGYNLDSLSTSLAMVTKALLGDQLPPIPRLKDIDPAAVTAIKKVIECLKPHWSVLNFHS